MRADAVLGRFLAALAATLVAAVFSLVTLVAQQPLGAGARERIDRVFAAYDRTSSPGCALAIYRDGAILYERGYGMASLEHGIAITPETVFDIGSTSKQFTAFSILLLERQGKLSLDDDVRKFLPELPAYERPIAIRHLMQHTSGLRDYLGPGVSPASRPSRGPPRKRRSNSLGGRSGRTSGPATTGSTRTPATCCSRKSSNAPAAAPSLISPAIGSSAPSECAAPST